MLSIIVCSRYNQLNEAFSTNIEKSVGVEFELICIDNSQSNYSIAQAYNEGKRRSKFSYLCFVHEDVFIHTQNWGEKVIAHLNVPNTGLVGLAGGDAALRVLYDYGSLNRSTNIIHFDKRGIEPTEQVIYPENYSEPTRSVVLLDGVLLCAKSELFEKISFDETLGAFHGYDYDISIQSIASGYYNYVIYDILLTHYSKGNFDSTYYKSIIKVIEKWNLHLPFFEHSISENDQKKIVPIIEKRVYKKLLKRLIHSGIKTSDIIEIYSFYTIQTHLKSALYSLKIIRIRIFFIWIISVLRKKI